MNRSIAHWRNRLRRRANPQPPRPRQNQPGYRFNNQLVEDLIQQQQQQAMEVEENQPPRELPQDEPPANHGTPNRNAVDNPPPPQEDERADDEETVYHDSREDRNQDQINYRNRLFTPPMGPFSPHLSPIYNYNPQGRNPQRNVIMKSKINLPAFDEETPEISLEVLQSILEAQNITDDAEKYLYLISTLKPDHLRKAAKYLARQGENSRNTYKKLKDGLLKIYAKTSTLKFEEMINKKYLETKKPSELLNEVKIGLGIQLNKQDLPEQIESTLKKIWLSKLSNKYRAALAIHETKNIQELQEYADAIYDNTSKDEDTVEKDDIFEKEITKRIGKMEQELLKYKTREAQSKNNYNKEKKDYSGYWQQRQRSWQNNKNYQPQRPNFTQKKEIDQYNAPNTCFYHKKFKADSRRCDPAVNCPFRNDAKEIFLGKKAATQ